jgi:hypothetical protein
MTETAALDRRALCYGDEASPRVGLRHANG